MGGVIFFISTQLMKQTVTIESVESKTIEGHEVFNQISFKSQNQQDIWSMKQSHQGRSYPLNQWDELKITVDKTSRPFKVSYSQLQNGKEVEFKVSCYFCHSNGPRAIRPNFESEKAPLDLTSKMALRLFNLKIKTYGKMEIQKTNLKIGTKERTTPLKYFGRNEVAPLQLATCTICHHDQFWGRGTLTRQNALPIEHLVKNNLMPPWPFQLSAGEKKQIENYLKGF